MNWFVYIIHCSDDTFYTGISTDVQRRFKEHAEQRGAKYFRARRPVQLIYLERGHQRSSASRREAQIKKMSRAEKNALLHSQDNEIASLDTPAQENPLSAENKT